MKKGQAKAIYFKTNGYLNIKLTVYKWYDDDDSVFYLYSPALNLTGYGKSEEEAEGSFKVVLDEYVNYTAKKGTLYNDLEKHGWLVNKNHRRVKAPTIREMFDMIPDFKSIYRKSEKETLVLT